MRQITSTLNTEITNPVTTPAFFVEILFSTPEHLCSRGTINWNGSTWIGRGISINGIGNDISTPQQTGNLVLNDMDEAITTVILREGIASRGINIWKFYGTAPGPYDPIMVFNGVGDTVSMDEKSGGVNITLAQLGVQELYAPRRYMTRASGFSILPVTGTVIHFNGENYKLERYRG